MLRRNIACMNELEMKGFIFDFIQKADGKKLERFTLRRFSTHAKP